MTVESGEVVLAPEDFPGRQGRVGFAFLVGNRRLVARTALAEAIWPSDRPPSWKGALSSIVSKLRALLTRVGLDRPDPLESTGRCYQLRLPRDTWIDHDVAAACVRESESALKARRTGRALRSAATAGRIASRPFLPGVRGRWLERRRERLARIRVRALECRARAHLADDEHEPAVEAAREAVAVRPFRETSYQLLMRAHAAAGNTAEALRVYERCRSLIADELGVSPSQETRTVYAEVLERL